MKYYSEVTKQVYNTEKELIQAENVVAEKNKAAELLKTQRAERAKEVENACKHASELLAKFIEDYGSFHTSLKEAPKDIFDYFFDLF